MSLTLSGSRAGAVSVAVAALAFPHTAHAAHAADAPGNNGTIKVHEPGQPLENSNVPQPESFCAFYIAGFNFDRNQVVNYKFEVQGGPDTGDAAGVPGSFVVGPDNGKPRGDGRSRLLEKIDHRLPDGTYNVIATTTDGSKSKVLKINCPGGNNPEPPTTVGGVGNPDDGEAPVGGVDTGGGGRSGGPAVV